MKWKYCLSISLYVCKTLSPLTASISQIINKYPSLFLCPSFVIIGIGTPCNVPFKRNVPLTSFRTHTKKSIQPSTINHLSIFQWMYLPITGNYFLFVALDSVERIIIGHFFSTVVYFRSNATWKSSSDSGPGDIPFYCLLARNPRGCGLLVNERLVPNPIHGIIWFHGFFNYR